jgi:5-oxoprolinase (ATP-hydrolysing)
LVVDFEGTGPASSGNLNAPPAVARAAVLYVVRCLLGREIPLNEGCLDAVEIRIPPGSLLNPPPGSAVVGGNVETSQRIVDVLLGALGVAAASQGTMNNLTFGNDRFGYYETICGGAGAGPGRPGAHGVHTHMTNTRITDVEVLESRCPVRLRKFGLRVGSGGVGASPGGDGVVRRLEFLEGVRVSFLSERRATPPFGLRGGGPGACGEAIFKPSGEAAEKLPGRFTLDVGPGDVLEIRTPGGGAFGEPVKVL